MGTKERRLLCVCVCLHTKLVDIVIHCWSQCASLHFFKLSYNASLLQGYLFTIDWSNIQWNVLLENTMTCQSENQNHDFAFVSAALTIVCMCMHAYLILTLETNCMKEMLSWKQWYLFAVSQENLSRLGNMFFTVIKWWYFCAVYLN